MPKYKIIFILLFFLFFVNIPKVHSQLYGFQISGIEPKEDFAKVFLPSLSFEAFSINYDFDDHFKYGMAVGVTVLNASKDTFDFGDHSRRVFERCYEFQAGLLMTYYLLKEDFTPFIGLDIYLMGVKYNYTQVPPLYFEMDHDIEFGISGIPKIGVSYKLLDEYVFTLGVGYAFRYKMIEGEKERFFKYFLSVGYFY